MVSYILFMGNRFEISGTGLAALAIVAASSCAQSPPGADLALTPVGSCKVYEGKGETTEYTVELGVSRGQNGNESIVLGIQGFHPNDTSPQDIVEIRLVGIAQVMPEQLSNDCVCGVEFRGSDDMCAYISTYKASLQEAWLGAASGRGLDLQFELENGLVVPGPHIPASEVEAFLARIR